MKKAGKILLFTLIILSGWLALFGCEATTTQAPADNTFTVTFVSYDGTALKAITCIKGEACDIAGNEPNPPLKENCDFTRWSVWESEYATIQTNTTIKAIYTYDNRLISIGDRDIVFYSVFIMMGIMIAFFLGLREGKRTGVSSDDLIDGFLWIVPVAILGARLWYVAFEFDMFVVNGNAFATIMQIIGFRYVNGAVDFSSFGLEGLAIHGAFTTALVCAYFYTRKKKISMLKVLDLVAMGFIFAQTFGRWGNFLNQEAHGGLVGGGALSLEEQFNYLRYTLHIPEFIVNNMYIVDISDVALVPGFYHPTFLYELLLNWIGFFIILVIRRLKSVKIGEIMAFYLVWYGAVRIFIESMRTDPLVYEIFGLTLKAATTTSILMILGGIGLSICIRFWWKGASYETIPGHFEFLKKNKKAELINEKA
ncbi:MAG: prolipoprotein diacylglyceryl transferase [Candidatus Izemoplasmatales bacterium]|nr:prolipoprotein diacylglyceryl transferase [Candidatus Izemoplasmatales bacterium]